MRTYTRHYHVQFKGQDQAQIYCLLSEISCRSDPGLSRFSRKLHTSRSEESEQGRDPAATNPEIAAFRRDGED